MICNHCGQSLPEGTAFCTNCGAPVAQEQPVGADGGANVGENNVTCPHCGQVLAAGTTFCTNCGAPVAEQQTASADMSAQAAAAPVGDSSYIPPTGNQTPPTGYQTPPPYHAPAGNMPPYGGMPYSSPMNQNQIPSIGTYVLWFILSAIPIVGLIVDIVWAVDKSYPARANFFRAMLILLAIQLVGSFILGLLAGTLLFPLFAELAEEFYYYF